MTEKETMNKATKRRLAISGLIFANVVWGISAPLFKWALQDIHLYTFLFLRNVIPAVIMMLLFRKHLKVKRKDFLGIFLLAFFGITLNFYFGFVGLIHSQSINAPIIGSSGPIFLMLGSLLFFKEIPTRKAFLGNLIGFFGVMVIVMQPLFTGGPLDASFGGNVYMVLSTLAGIIFMLLAKKLDHTYRVVTIISWYFAIGAATFAIPFAGEVAQYGFLTNIHMQGLLGLIFATFAASLLGYSLLTWAIKYIQESEVGIFTYLDPVATIVLAIPLLHEYPSPTFIFGSFLIFFGIYIAENRLNWHPIYKLFKK